MLPSALIIMLTALALFSCGDTSNHSSSAQLAATPATTPPQHKAIALTGTGAGGGEGLDNLDGGGEGIQVEPWFDPDAGVTINIISGEAIINLAFDFSGLGEDPQVNVDLLDAQFAQEPTVHSQQNTSIPKNFTAYARKPSSAPECELLSGDGRILK